MKNVLVLIYYLPSKVFKRILLTVFLVFVSVFSNAQLTLLWDTYTSGSENYTKTASCITMDVVVTYGSQGDAEWNVASGPYPRYWNPGGGLVPGYQINPDWLTGNPTKSITTTMDFKKSGVSYADVVSFNLYDVNGGGCNSLSKFIDDVTIYGITSGNVQIRPNSVTSGCASMLIQTTANTTIIKGHPNCGDGAFAPFNTNYVSVNFSSAVKTVVVIYRPGSGLAGNDAAPCGTSYPLLATSNPIQQYIRIGSITFGTSSTCSLPIELLNFDALFYNYQLNLFWTTSSETNNDYFTIEGSENAIDFNEIARIEGAGNSNNVKNYSYSAPRLFNNYHYFRLKQTDYDGKFSYSEIKKVICNEENDGIKWTLKENMLSIAFDNTIEGEAEIRLLDFQGKTVIRKNVITNYTKQSEMNLSGLSPGVYILNIYCNSQIYSNKLLLDK